MKRIINLFGEIEIKMMERKSIRKLWAAISLVLVLMLALPSTAFAQNTIDNATLTFDGITVPPGLLMVGPGATISASITVQVGDGSYDAWKSTNWMIKAYNSVGVWTCVDTPDHNNIGTYTENFNITAPSSPGIYNVYFRAHNTEGCPDASLSSYYANFNLLNSVVVEGAEDLIESYGSGCTMQMDDFGGGQGVCMKATDLDTGNWQIQWIDPDGQDVRSVAGEANDGEYSDSWSPIPCKEGTWTVGLRKGVNHPTTGWEYDTVVDVDTFNLTCEPSLASYQANCSTMEDNFAMGDTVCMKGTALGTNPLNNWRIEWWAPGASSATRTSQAPIFSTVTFNDLWEPSPCVAGTWTVNLIKNSSSPLSSWSTEDTDTFNLTCGTCTPPSVTTNPSDQTITYGENASFSVAGTNYTSVQWQVESGSSWSDLTGETSETLDLTIPDVSMNGNQYRAVLSGDCGLAATSTAATLTVYADPFVEFSGLTSSLNPSVYGDTVTFRAVASTSGGAPGGKVIFYELVPAGMSGFTTILLGEDTTGDSIGEDSYAYTFSTSTLAIGDHYIMAGYAVGTETSTESAGPLNQTVSSQVWPTVTITSAPPATSYNTQATFEFNSDTEGTGFECSLNEGAISSFEDLTWSACSSPKVYTELSYGGSYTFVVKVEGAPIAATTMAWHQWFITVPQVSITGGPPEVTDSTEATLTFTSDPTGVDLECYLVAQEYGTQDAVILENWAPCTSPRTLTGLSRGYAYYFEVKPRGATDNYAAMRQWMITRISLAASPNPSEFGSDVTFTATLWDDSGTTPTGTVTFAEMIYLWPGGVSPQPLGQDSSPTANGTGSYTYTFSTSVLAIGSHEIIALYTDETGTITSLIITQEVTEVIAQAPVIITQPSNHTACAGTSVSFTAAASGTPVPTVQWQGSTDGGTTWNNISGATTTTYTFTTVATDNGKRYRAVFTNSAGSDTSSAAILTVNSPPFVSTQPANQTVTYGDPSATFSAAASGTAPSVQWHSSTDGTTWELVSGATTPNLTIANPTVLMSGTQYRVEFSNVCGTATSNAATLTVNKAEVTATAGNYSGIYDGATHSPSGCLVTGEYTGDLNCTNSLSTVGPIVGSGTIVPVLVLNGEEETNFSVISVNSDWEITPAAVTMTAGSYSGTYNGESHSPSVCKVMGAYTSTLSCTNNPASVGPNVGSGSVAPVIVLNGETVTNFSVTPQNGSWEITPAAVTMTAGDYTGTYNGESHSPSACEVTGTYTGTLSCTNNPSSVGPDVGLGEVEPVLVLNGEIGTNFTITPQDGSWEITPAVVTMTAGDYNGTYDGVAHSPLECTVTGGYTGNLSCTNDPDSVGPDVGLGIVAPVLVLNGETVTNFNVTPVNGSWKITPAAVTITAGEYSGTYYGSAHSPSACAVTGAYTGNLSCTNDPALVGPNVGSGSVTPVLVLNGEEEMNFSVTSENGSWEITPAAVTITAGDYSGTYDGIAHSPIACEVTGGYTGDLTCTNDPALIGPNVGSGSVAPVIVLNGETESNFSVTSENGSWEITPAAVTITAGDYNGTYDGAAHPPSACEVTGVYTGDLSCINDPASVGPDVGSGDVGPVLVLNGETASNFSVTPEKGSWEITTVAVTITAGDYTGTYDGAAHSPSACAVTGVYTGDLSCINDPASVGPDVGSGDVGPVLVLNGETASNFSVTPEKGSWEITTAAVTITAGDYNGTYDGAAHPPSACEVTGVYTGDLSCINDPASVGPDVGSGDVGPVLVLNGETESNFSVTPVIGSWEITPATLTITPNNQTAQYSDATPPLTFQYAGFVPGENSDDLTDKPSCSTTRLISSSVGNYPITCSGEAADNYTFSYVAGTFTVTKEDVTITLDNEVAFLVDNPGEDIETLVLYADVQETYPDAGYEPAAGEVDNAQISMTLTPVGVGGPLTGNCVKDHDNGSIGYNKINTYACTFTHVEVNTYLIEVNVVGNYYSSTPAEDVLVVYDPSLGFTTAGGWFYWPGTTDKTNFGYTMKYNKKGNKVQGSLLLIRHTDEGNYRIKSNALYGLALGEFEEAGQNVGWASFSGKCTYQEPDWLEPEGNHEFLVYVEDWGDPGVGMDRFWIDVSDDGGNLSLGSDTNSWVFLDGGNIVVPHKPK